MRPFQFLPKLSLIALTAILMVGCAETKFVLHTAKRLGETTKSQGAYKVGKPYQIQGQWYYPGEDMSYDRTGIASWYGPNFHGKPTANGEVFDQWEVSAAHKTLPLPSIVRVTNLDNGRSLVIRINDRGPFKPGRIIDLSRRAAQLLGSENAGTAQVRVQILAKESRQAKLNAMSGNRQLAYSDAPIKAQNVASKPVTSQPLPAPTLAKTSSNLYVEPAPLEPPPQPARVMQTKITGAQVGDVSQGAVLPMRMFVQAGAFSNPYNAEQVKARLDSLGTDLGNVRITPFSMGGKALFRVRVGPIGDVAQADATLAQVIEAGYAGARTVVEKKVTN
ncbi:MAG: septal ring lytic transglycosylase RlpA family protein [Magnetovibrio sp.]|nr:septal ring lytic transglycosylase RlpA family protein [Magnetovibrio sp.]